MKKVFWGFISVFLMTALTAPCLATGVGEKLEQNEYGGVTLTEGDGDRFVAKPDGKGGYRVEGPGGYTATAQPDGNGGYTASDSKGYSYKAVGDGRGGHHVAGTDGWRKWVAEANPAAAGEYSVNSRYE